MRMLRLSISLLDIHRELGCYRTSLKLLLHFSHKFDFHLLCNRSSVWAAQLQCVLRQVSFCVSFLTSPQPCPTKGSVVLFPPRISRQDGFLHWCVGVFKWFQGFECIFKSNTTFCFELNCTDESESGNAGICGFVFFRASKKETIYLHMYIAFFLFVCLWCYDYISIYSLQKLFTVI